MEQPCPPLPGCLIKSTGQTDFTPHSLSVIIIITLTIIGPCNINIWLHKHILKFENIYTTTNLYNIKFSISDVDVLRHVLVGKDLPLSAVGDTGLTTTRQ